MEIPSKVHLKNFPFNMKIYTKTGDDGTTSLFRGGRVTKNDSRIESYGTVDELNALLGYCDCLVKDKYIKGTLEKIQNTLFILGSDLATPREEEKGDQEILRINEKHISELECLIDEFDEKLPALKNFILPGGSEGASVLHYARTVCRRAEREIVSLSSTADIGNFIIIYVNRLSDLLFVLARYENHANNIPETIWESPS